MERKCKTCAWWDVSVARKDFGSCRYNAPTWSTFGDLGETQDGWPTVGDEDWCRHWSKTTGWEEGTEQAQRLADYLDEGSLRKDGPVSQTVWTEQTLEDQKKGPEMPDEAEPRNTLDEASQMAGFDPDSPAQAEIKLKDGQIAYLTDRLDRAKALFLEVVSMPENQRDVCLWSESAKAWLDSVR